MRATARNLRSKTREIFDAIERGEEIVITYRGKVRPKSRPYPFIIKIFHIFTLQITYHP